MKSFAVIAAFAGAASAQAALGSCAQMCVNNMNIIANTQFSCAAGDSSCFCTRSNWAYGVRDCSREACGTEESAQAIAYAVGLCQGVASVATGSATDPAALPILTSALASATGASGSASGEASATNSASASAITTEALLATVTNSDGNVETTTTGFSTVYSSGALTESAASMASSAASSLASDVSSALSSVAESASSAVASASDALESAASSASSAVSGAASSAASSVPSQGAAPKMTGVPVAAGLAAAAWFLI